MNPQTFNRHLNPQKLTNFGIIFEASYERYLLNFNWAALELEPEVS